jgi:HTH-type transcriptional regulator/antitoxin HipB
MSSFPNGIMDLLPITDSNALGAAVRARRHQLELSQEELADVARVGLRFLSELERGKASAQYAGIQRVLEALGLGLYLKAR